jgi:hypothetical protein
MKTIRFILAFICLLLFNQLITAQDKIYKLNGEVIECKVVEIASDQIKYSVPDFGPDVLIGIKKSEVDKILFGSGKEMTIDHAEETKETMEMNSDLLFKVQKKNDIKMEFLAPLNSVLAFTYEHCIKPGRSWEATIGFVGIGFENPDDAQGIALKGGYKFMKSPDFYMQGMRYAHILKGGYVRPELLFASYKGTRHSFFQEPEDYNRVKFAALINLGKQFVFSDVFLLDLYFGLGYGYTNAKDFGGYPYVFAVTSRDVPLALSYGFRIGFLFK